MKKEVLLAIVLLLLVACMQTREFPVSSYKPAYLPPQENNQVRPVIEKIVPEQTEQEDSGNQGGNDAKQVKSLSPEIEEYRLQVGYGLIPLNHSLTTTHFTKYDFPNLLKTRPLSSDVELVSARYDQFLRLLGGRVLFTGDDYENIRDYLFYEDGEPIYEYEFYLSAGMFLDYVGSKIWFLGHEYIIKEATKEDVTLLGEDGSELVVGGGKILLNGIVLEDTESRMYGNSLYIVSKADSVHESNDVYVPSGSSLQKHVGEPTMLTNKIDIAYKGLLEVPMTSYHFNNKGDHVKLRIKGHFGDYNLPLVSEGVFLGDDEGMMHIQEASSTTDYKVGMEDYFVVTASGSYQSQGLISTVMQYKEINHKERTIEFISSDEVGIKGFYTGTPGTNATGSIHFLGRSFRFYVGPGTQDNPIAVDMNGDGAVSGSFQDLYIANTIVDFPNQEIFNRSFNITLRMFSYGYGVDEESAIIRVNPDLTMELFSGNPRFDIGKDNEAEVSARGTTYFLLSDEGQGFEEIYIEHPLEQRFAEIVVEAR